VANTDEDGWGRVSQKGYLRTATRIRRAKMGMENLPSWCSALRRRFVKRPMKTQKLNQIKPFLNHRWTRIGSEPSWCPALQWRGSGLIRPNPTMDFKKNEKKGRMRHGLHELREAHAKDPYVRPPDATRTVVRLCQTMIFLKMHGKAERRGGHRWTGLDFDGFIGIVRLWLM